MRSIAVALLALALAGAVTAARADDPIDNGGGISVSQPAPVDGGLGGMQPDFSGDGGGG